MTMQFRPVLVLPDPAAGLDWFAELPGMVVDRTRGLVVCGDLSIALRNPDDMPPVMRTISFDHLALRVDDVDAVLSRLVAGGVRLHPAYTPAGPREISVFWNKGVRFAFVMGPGGTPVEICARLGVGSGGGGVILGLDHLGLRTGDVAAAAGRLVAEGAVGIAQHLLPGPIQPVDVRFLTDANLVWEVFDEVAPGETRRTAAHWAGVAPAD